MTEQTTDANPFVPPWSGFHHIALVTRDLDGTMRFYRDVLGMEIIFTAPAGDLHGRHCAFHFEGDPDRLGLHFFEYPGAPLFGPEDRTLDSTSRRDEPNYGSRRDLEYGVSRQQWSCAGGRLAKASLVYHQVLSTTHS